jgi:hypothetical protein
MLEVVYDTLAIEEVHGDSQEVPIERLCEAKAARLTRNVGDSDDLFERDDLNRGDNDDDVQMARAESTEEEAYHHECPYCAHYEIGLLLLVLALRWLCCLRVVD